MAQIYSRETMVLNSGLYVLNESLGGDFHLYSGMIDREGLHNYISSGHALSHNAYRKMHRGEGCQTEMQMLL